MMRHTPGPWAWSEGTGEYETSADLHRAEYNVGEADSILYHGADWPMTPADKALIAAAPELLEACLRLLEQQDDAIANGVTLDDDEQAARDYAFEVIAKATKGGQEPSPASP
jgi:hypothetical protein